MSPTKDRRSCRGAGGRIHRHVRAYRATEATPNHRYRSWEHCYAYFRKARSVGLDTDRDHAALHLAFYLASWGMYRGSAFLLQYDYTVHLEVISLIGERRFDRLWDADFGMNETDDQLIPEIWQLIDGVREIYKPFASAIERGEPTDTLITKVILGTVGCLPACDQYFIAGLKHECIPYSKLTGRFIDRIHDFCQRNLASLRKEQASIGEYCGITYPLMKLVDMYFWQVGFDNS